MSKPCRLLTLSLVLVACGDDATESATQSSSASTASTTEPGTSDATTTGSSETDETSDASDPGTTAGTTVDPSTTEGTTEGTTEDPTDTTGEPAEVCHGYAAAASGWSLPSPSVPFGEDLLDRPAGTTSYPCGDDTYVAYSLLDLVGDGQP
ncbi:MAG: hypothetical protein KC636_27730, partial [Myxococcales bacterium]|nr:hypothetical protein [Myxococcales bacterium]